MDWPTATRLVSPGRSAGENQQIALMNASAQSVGRRFDSATAGHLRKICHSSLAQVPLREREYGADREQRGGCRESDLQ